MLRSVRLNARARPLRIINNAPHRVFSCMMCFTHTSKTKAHTFIYIYPYIYIYTYIYSCTYIWRPINKLFWRLYRETIAWLNMTAFSCKRRPVISNNSISQICPYRVYGADEYSFLYTSHCFFAYWIFFLSVRNYPKSLAYLSRFSCVDVDS